MELLPNDMIRYILSFLPDYNRPILSLTNKRFYGLIPDRKANLIKLVKKGKLKLLKFAKENKYWSIERLNQLLIVAVKASHESITIWLLELGANDIDLAIKKSQLYDKSILFYYKFRSDIEAVRDLPHWKGEWICTVDEAKRFVNDLKEHRNILPSSLCELFNVDVYSFRAWFIDSQSRSGLSNRILSLINFNPIKRLEEYSDSESDDDLDLTEKFREVLSRI